MSGTLVSEAFVCLLCTVLVAKAVQSMLDTLLAATNVAGLHQAVWWVVPVC
jgi:hypothetical protein